ncbi:DUF4169 family protein [Sphingosinicella sp. BN140058]|uniref:DUF4169 family protein n=1 Tax=Sphingosinicella sp. BN140058 TaxID=1892855 RepID=UPI00101366BB|nr:DUF4169 family protein [Sphingosinicella sp. BN140058]QAY75390.1 DUF4169 family protein [Sphingosinicella sp. BN140058]
MADIINLRMARKAQARAAKDAAAERNRAAHGRTAAERKTAKMEADRQRRLLDAARRDAD